MFEVLLAFLVLAYVFGLGVVSGRKGGAFYDNVVNSLLYPVKFLNL